jgi:O-antigen biosynthesis protein
MKISVVVNTKNEEKYLDNCLRSVSCADEIIVVDMQSTDNTVSIARKYTNLIYTCDDFNYVEPVRNQSISYATGDWIFILDADEIIPDHLFGNIHDIISKNEDVSLIAIPRKNYIGKHLIVNSGWGLDYQPRLFKRGKITWTKLIHTWPEVDGKILYLDPSEDFYIQHYNYLDLSDFIERLNRYTDIEANDFDSTILNSDWKNIFQLSLDEFKTRYTPQDDGLYSLSLAGCMSFYKFIVCCKALEKDNKNFDFLLPSSIEEILANFIPKNSSQLDGYIYEGIQAELTQSQYQLQQIKTELAKSQFQVQQVRMYFEEAINEIASMETSKFWKLRKAWFKLKRLIIISRQTLITEGLLVLVIKVSRKIKKKIFSTTEKSSMINLEMANLDVVSSIELITSSNPIVSIIVPVFNQSKYTFNCLNSLKSIQSVAYEVIVVNDASTDDTQAVLRNISGIRIITNSDNIGFIRSCNRGSSEARGEFICFLNNDTKVFPNWMESLLEVISNNQTVGAVGSKLIYPDGRLQEAGGIIWKDASGCNFGRLENPTNPEYNYVREVDYCSGASLLVRSELFKSIGGFSEEFLPAYYEDTDLCFTIRSLGYKVMYQPRSQVIHFEGISSGTDINSGVKKHQQTNAIKFEIKWRETLKEYLPQDTKDRDGARRHSETPTILIIDSYVPLYDKEAGSYRLYNIIKIFKNLGYSIIFLPDNGLYQEPYVSELQGMGVEVIYSTDEMPEMKSHLLERLAIVDIAWVCRPELCEKYFGLLSQNPKIKVIYDTIDLHFIRLKREKELLGENSHQPIPWQDFQKQELRLAKLVHKTIVVTNVEKNILSSFGVSNISVIPTIHQAYTKSLPKFHERNGLLFIGGYNHLPNVDAAIWLCGSIMPLIWAQYPDMRLTLLGSNPPTKVKNLQDDRVTVTGYIHDVEPYFLNHRVFVAPLRYGAGIKGKVGQSLSYGLPIVSTSIGIEGFDLTHELEAMIADEAEDFANSILTLYENINSWEDLSEAGIKSIDRYSLGNVSNTLQNLINSLLVDRD